LHQRGEDVNSAIQGLRLDKIGKAQEQTIRRIADELKTKGKEVEDEELAKKLRDKKLLIGVEKRR